MPVIHETYEGRTEVRTARKHYRCQHQRKSWFLDPEGFSVCGRAILPGETYVVETAMPWSDCGPFYRIERIMEPVTRSGVFLYHKEVTKRIRSVSVTRLCLDCAQSESHAYRRHTMQHPEFEPRNDRTPHVRNGQWIGPDDCLPF